MSAVVHVVTGATSGIGLATARQLAAGGDAVYLVGRDPMRTRAAVEEVRAGADGPIRAFVADLASQRAVRTRVADVRHAIDDDGLVLGSVVHSAGVYSSRRAVTDDGIELTFAVNHLAPFLLTRELLVDFAPAAAARIVVVGSNAHRAASIDPLRVEHARGSRPLRAYNQSKLANELFVRALAARLSASDAGAYVVDPGLVNTAIGTKHSGPFSRLVWHFRRQLGSAPDVPAHTITALATGALGRGESGTTWRDGRRIEPSTAATDRELAEQLWRVSCELCGVAEWPVPAALVSPGASAAPR